MRNAGVRQRQPEAEGIRTTTSARPCQPSCKDGLLAPRACTPVRFPELRLQARPARPSQASTTASLATPTPAPDPSCRRYSLPQVGPRVRTLVTIMSTSTRPAAAPNRLLKLFVTVGCTCCMARAAPLSHRWPSSASEQLCRCGNRRAHFGAVTLGCCRDHAPLRLCTNVWLSIRVAGKPQHRPAMTCPCRRSLLVANSQRVNEPRGEDHAHQGRRRQRQQRQQHALHCPLHVGRLLLAVLRLHLRFTSARDCPGAVRAQANVHTVLGPDAGGAGSCSQRRLTLSQTPPSPKT